MTVETTTTRKAVVTTDSVRSALEGYKAIKKTLGEDLSGWEFDKGIRGKGFAIYNGQNIESTFETKEEAYLYFSRYVQVANEVMEALLRQQAQATDTAVEAAKAAKPATRKPAEKVPA